MYSLKTTKPQSLSVFFKEVNTRFVLLHFLDRIYYIVSIYLHFVFAILLKVGSIIYIFATIKLCNLAKKLIKTNSHIASQSTKCNIVFSCIQKTQVVRSSLLTVHGIGAILVSNWEQNTLYTKN